MVSWSSAGMPGPLSMISTLVTRRWRVWPMVNWRRVRERRVMRPRRRSFWPARACMALRTILSTAWIICSLSMKTSGMLGS
ncbi:hypothetical protein D3C72_2086040 [compost metagenome]